MIALNEQNRRKPGAAGTPVRLADGCRWLLANPSFRPGPDGLTSPAVDPALDRAFECNVLGEGLELTEVWAAARQLLRANYDLSDEELGELLTTSPGAEGSELASGVVRALCGADQNERTYTRWVRASLLANNLSACDIPAPDLSNVLAVLVATNRTVPLSSFADACRRVDERARLEGLI